MWPLVICVVLDVGMDLVAVRFVCLCFFWLLFWLAALRCLVLLLRVYFVFCVLFDCTLCLNLNGLIWTTSFKCFVCLLDLGFVGFVFFYLRSAVWRLVIILFLCGWTEYLFSLDWLC